MFKYRLILGLIFSALLVALIALDSFASRHWPDSPAPPGLVIALLTLAVVPFAIAEMRRLLQKENVTISLRITVSASILCMLWPWLEQVAESSHQSFARWLTSVKPHYLVPTVLAASLVAAFIKHSRHQRVDGAIANAGGTLLAIVYLGVLPGFFLPICLSHSAWMVLAVVAVVKAADIGAYATGKMIGRHKLIAWLSPGKTVEGFFGGLGFSALAAAGIAAWFHESSALWAARPVTLTVAMLGGAGVGLILGAVGQLGDLLESLLKRDAGVKDSGHVPGFGGVLDLLDSPLLAAPVAYWLFKLLLPAG